MSFGFGWLNPSSSSTSSSSSSPSSAPSWTSIAKQTTANAGNILTAGLPSWLDYPNQSQSQSANNTLAQQYTAANPPTGNASTTPSLQPSSGSGGGMSTTEEDLLTVGGLAVAAYVLYQMVS